MRAVAFALLPLTAACTCSVPFEIIYFDAGSDGGDRPDAGEVADAGASDGGEGDGGLPCAGRDATSCAKDPACRVLQCPSCVDCAMTFIACSDAGVSDVACPACATPQCCNDSAQCTTDLLCLGPGDPMCPFFPCAIADGCVTDVDCGASVCEPDDCCVGNVCKPACTNQSCPAGQQCNADGHCVPASCNITGGCPPGFSCGVMTNTCARTSCGSDADCAPGGSTADGGALFCVNDHCYASQGTCWTPGP